MINYKFKEEELIKELQKYVDTTYDQHYATDKYQATDIIIDSGHGTGFCLGNVMKYAKRYGNKGTPEDHRKDIMKILHYALIQLYIHDVESTGESDFDNPRAEPSFLTEGEYPEYDSKLAPGHHLRLNDVSPEEWDRMAGYANRIKGVSLSG
jgi:hypothetical protein